MRKPTYNVSVDQHKGFVLVRVRIGCDTLVTTNVNQRRALRALTRIVRDHEARYGVNAEGHETPWLGEAFIRRSTLSIRDRLRRQARELKRRGVRRMHVSWEYDDSGPEARALAMLYANDCILKGDIKRIAYDAW